MRVTPPKSTRSPFALFMLLATLAFHSNVLADVWYVDRANTSGVEDGKSWSTAFTKLQPAIDAASIEGWGQVGLTEVWVAEGVYDEQRGGAGEVELRPWVKLLGGFSGTETDPGQRDWVKHHCIIDGARARGGQQAYTVVGTQGLCELSGFTIRGGAATTEPYWTSGGGLNSRYGSLTVRHCIFEDNEAASVGGGAYCANGPVAFEDCTFRGNTAGAGGGGLSFASGSLQLIDCRFENNVAQRSGTEATGGGLYAHDATTVEVRRCIFANDEAKTYGGGAYTVAFTSQSFVFLGRGLGRVQSWRSRHALETQQDCDRPVRLHRKCP